MNNPRDISDENNKQKQNAFSLNAFRFIRLINGNRPSNAETNQHDDFKNTHSVNDRIKIKKKQKEF